MSSCRHASSWLPTGKNSSLNNRQSNAGFSLSARQIGLPSGCCVAEHLSFVFVLQGEEEGEGAGRAVEEVGGLGAEAGP